MDLNLSMSPSYIISISHLLHLSSKFQCKCAIKLRIRNQTTHMNWHSQFWQEYTIKLWVELKSLKIYSSNFRMPNEISPGLYATTSKRANRTNNNSSSNGVKISQQCPICPSPIINSLSPRDKAKNKVSPNLAASQTP